MKNLQHLIAGYFYQEWNEQEYGSWEQAVDDFVRRSPNKAPLVPKEIDSILKQAADEEELDRTLVSWGLSHTPPEGEAAWLRAVRNRIEIGLGA